jgi:predicted anti-sigma-YlaC factor YlaD
MNCFEARQEFPALWRKTATPERSAELYAHLKECPKCDHAFRVFALSAPVLHSPAEPERNAAEYRRRAAYNARRGLSVTRPAREPRRLLAMCAGVMVIVAASTAAYLSVAAPIGSYTDEITNSESVFDFPVDATPTSNDFAG